MFRFSFLTVEVGAYLPPYTSINVYFMKDLIAGIKRIMKVQEMKYLYVPQYETLSLGKILRFAQGYQGVFDFLPVEKDLLQLPRQVRIIVFTHE